jgi:DnaK suppressor protein
MKAKKANVVVNSPDYIPSVDEKYMNARQIAYFKDILEKWRIQTHNNLNEAQKKLEELNGRDEHDEMDKAFMETETAISINNIAGCQNLLNDIDISLGDIEIGNYGYCRKTGKEVGLKRLMAKPTSRYAIKAQEDSERQAKPKSRAFEDEIINSVSDEEAEPEEDI